MAAKKPEGFVVEKPFTQCAGNPECRYAGRLWVRTLPHDKRLCVNHYYRAIEEDRSLVGDPTVPPTTPRRMPGITPKAVAGH